MHSMKKMIGFVRPLIPQMILAVCVGVFGFLMAFGLGILGGYGIAAVVPGLESQTGGILFGGISLQFVMTALILCAICRGLLHYVEQYFNHFIAFKILAQFRNRIFAQMRRLAPAKTEGKNAGNLMSLITSDIELLEVFYAHTISPICIAIGTSLVLAVFYIFIHPLVALTAFVGYAIIGIILPLIVAGAGNKHAATLRKEIGVLNSTILDSLRGLREVIGYSQEEKTLQKVEDTTKVLVKKQEELRNQLGKLMAYSDTIMILIIVSMLAVCFALMNSGQITPLQGFIATLTMTSTFGPYVNLANLGNILTLTFASAERVFNLLEEQPEVEEVARGEVVDFDGMVLKNVSFGYDQQKVLKNINLEIKKGEILGIQGVSGCGKSTLLKLCMRFWEPQHGQISIAGRDLSTIQTKALRNMTGYVTQTTVLFMGTLRDNLLIANAKATDEELLEACRKASILDYINDLPKGLDTPVAELGDNFSGGERQRIGIARCFLSGAELILLDEPTSNLDSQNEAIILRALKEEKGDRTIEIGRASCRERVYGLV